MSHVLLNPSRFGSSLTWQQRVLAMPGLLGYWRLGETSGTTFADSSGGGHSFTQPAGVTLGASGVNTDGNKAILYGGTPASIANASWMNPGGDGTLWAMGCFKTGTTGT